MSNRLLADEPTEIKRKLMSSLDGFEAYLNDKYDLRRQVQELIPAYMLMRELGRSLSEERNIKAARIKIKLYLCKYVGQIIDGDELMVVAGISEYARRIRELRKEDGFRIVSGMTLKTLEPDELDDLFQGNVPDIKSEQYILLSETPDENAKNRWRKANTIRRKQKMSGRAKILEYFRENTGQIIQGEELYYVSNNQKDWSRRVRELRTEYGWPISTYFNGRRDLPVGVYVLEEDRQGPIHDRRIPDRVVRTVLRRDGYKCTRCSWSWSEADPSDPRHLEAHHSKPHVKGGENTEDNLVTLCNICHDAIHAGE